MAFLCSCCTPMLASHACILSLHHFIVCRDKLTTQAASICCMHAWPPCAVVALPCLHIHWPCLNIHCLILRSHHFIVCRDKLTTQAGLTNVLGALYASVLFFAIINALVVQPVISAERAVSYRERAAGMYSFAPWVLALVRLYLPVSLSICLSVCVCLCLIGCLSIVYYKRAAGMYSFAPWVLALVRLCLCVSVSIPVCVSLFV